MKLLILSDIHGNLQALQAVLKDAEGKGAIDACVLLGDLIDYGMHSNEVIKKIRRISYPLICNIWGNHEHSIIQKDYGRFSTARGIESAKHTADCLSKESIEYICNVMQANGKAEFNIDSKLFLAVHGSLEDIYWKSIAPNANLRDYRNYSVVLSGHSHLPHFFEVYSEADDPVMRNMKKIIFLNPGSVGQPRNHNYRAQYAIFDTVTEEAELCKAEYNILKEQSAYHNAVDKFYKERLSLGV